MKYLIFLMVWLILLIAMDHECGFQAHIGEEPHSICKWIP